MRHDSDVRVIHSDRRLIPDRGFCMLFGLWIVRVLVFVLLEPVITYLVRMVVEVYIVVHFWHR